MRKIGLVALLLVFACVSALGLAACGSSSGGKEGGTLTGSYAAFPEALDPAIPYSSEAWTAMYNTYIPLLTYAHASGAAGSKVIPGLATSLPKISNGGKTYTLTLRKGLKYSDGTSVRASDFPASVERMLALESGGTSFYTGIVGAEKFAETKQGPINGITADDKTGKIVINLTAPRGTFTNELALPFVALLPKNTPVKNLTADPPPATGPYEIVKSEPGRGWSYDRNPQWAKANGKLMPEIPAGHVDKIDIKVVSNDSTQVNEVERGKTDWMQTAVSADLYSKVKEKYEGSQFRVEPTVSTYYFWMNTTTPPFDDLKVRQAVNYAINPEALERIYAGTLSPLHQILPPGMPGHKPFDLYPHDMAKAKKMIAEANPSDRDITVWTDAENPNNEAAQYYQGVLEELGFHAKYKEINAESYAELIGNENTPDLDTGWFDWFQDYPHPNDFFQLQLSGESIAPTSNFNFARIDDPALNKKIKELNEEPLGPPEEAAYAKLDREFMEQAPWAPYGTLTTSTFVSSAIDLDKVIYNPTFGDDLTSFQFK
ncbi:MAG TPA: ABC transporter substrate-binding protein [Solirubrobacterales bacterium]|nr:ABC transporter substrate-binding protein [Solirubrobacterales bacterium]